MIVGFGPSDRASEAILSIGLYPRWVNLFFLHGVSLPDPHRLLKGKGKQVRHVVIEDATTLDRPEVRALIAQACKRASEPIDASRPRQIVVKAVAPKRRPRRPST